MPDEQAASVDQVTAVPPVVDTTPPVPETIALSPRLEAVGRPIPGANPCGKDVSYDDDYLAIKAEIDKLSTVSGRVDQEAATELRQMMDATRGTIKKIDRADAEKQVEQRGSVVEQSAGVDYQLIIDKSTRVLSEKAKDIRVASYLCFALWQKEKFSGLAEGLSAIDILIRDFWDGLFPAKVRMSARKNAIDFLTSKLGESVEYAQVRLDDREPLERAKTAIGGLQTHFTEKMPEGPPSLLGLSQSIEKCLVRVPKPAPAAKLSGAESGGATVQAQQPGAPVAGGELRTTQDAIDLTKKVARYLREQNRKNPMPYRLMRSVRWDSLTIEPPNDSGKTKVEVPTLQRRNHLSGLRDAGDWNKLLDECEMSFGQPGFHLWLDMQRLTVMALDALGAEYQGVRSAVLTELALLLKRLPKLSSLTFGDGTRFADPGTSDWIEEIVMPMLGTGESSSSVTVSRFGDGELDSQYAEAKKILNAGDFAGAITMLQGGANSDYSRKSAFRRKLALATLALQGNQASIARPLLENLTEEISKFLIDEWEPALALEVWTSLHKCYEALAVGPTGPAKVAAQQLAEKVFEKICRLDVGIALASTGVKSKAKRAGSISKPEAKQDAEAGSADESATKTDSEKDTKRTNIHPQS
jgi:type VI secretion system protein VasJ